MPAHSLWLKDGLETGANRLCTLEGANVAISSGATLRGISLLEPE